MYDQGTFHLVPALRGEGVGGGGGGEYDKLYRYIGFRTYVKQLHDFTDFILDTM